MESAEELCTVAWLYSDVEINWISGVLEDFLRYRFKTNWFSPSGYTEFSYG